MKKPSDGFYYRKTLFIPTKTLIIMVTAFATVFVMLMLGILWFRLNSKYQEEKLSFRMYELRDNLRVLATDGKVDRNSKIFEVTDKSFTAIGKNAYNISLPMMLLVALYHKDDNYIDNAEGVLKKSLNKFPELRDLWTEANKAISYNLKHQHPVLLFLFSQVLRAKYGAKRASEVFSKVKKAWIAPEASGSYEVVLLC